MTTPNHQENHTDLDALQVLCSIQPPAGMQERLVRNVAARARHPQFHPVASGFRKYARPLWAGASIVVAAAAVILCIFALQSNHAVHQPPAASVERPTIDVPLTSTRAVLANSPSRKEDHSHWSQKEDAAESVPHTPPPQPLTSQERLLLTLANTPSLAASVAQSQNISQHGLGANALFELDHEQLQPMLSESKVLQSLPPLPHNLP